MQYRVGAVSIFTPLLILPTLSFFLGCGSANNGNSIGTTGCGACNLKTTKYFAVAEANYEVGILTEAPIDNGGIQGGVGGTQTGQGGIWAAAGVAFDSAGNLYVADQGNNRVLQFSPPFSNGINASLVFGQSTFTSFTASSSSSGLNGPSGVAFDPSGNLWIADSVNSRILEFKPPFSSGMSASVAIGQSSISSTQGCNKGGVGNTVGSVNPTAGTLCAAQGIIFDSYGNLWVADGANNRVLEFQAPLSTGMAATLELGHASGANAFNTYQTNDGGMGAAAGTLWNPTGLTLDGRGNLWVADNNNNRVLEFVPPFGNGIPASQVVGQIDFTHNAHQAASQNSLAQPFGVAFDTAGSLVVTDTGNNRVMIFTHPYSNGIAADLIIGPLNSPLGIAAFDE